MKKLFVKIAVVVIALLAATAFFPDQVNQVSGIVCQYTDKWLARITITIAPFISSVPLSKQAIIIVAIIIWRHYVWYFRINRINNRWWWNFKNRPTQPV